jgi:hypothetical protein
LKQVIITNPADGQISESFIFKEVFDGKIKITPLEEEILGPDFITREDEGRLRVGSSESIPSDVPTEADLKAHLSPFEMKCYQQASISKRIISFK